MSLQPPKDYEPLPQSGKKQEPADKDFQRDLDELIKKYGDELIEEMMQIELPPDYEKDFETMDPIEFLRKYDPDMVTEDGYIVIK